MRQILFAMRNKYCLQCEKNIVCNARKFLLEIWEYETNIVGDVTEILFAMRDKLCLQCETNIVCNVRQILPDIWDKYCLQCERNIVCGVTKILFAMHDKILFTMHDKILFAIQDKYCLQCKTNTVQQPKFAPWQKLRKWKTDMAPKNCQLGWNMTTLKSKNA